MHYLIKIICTVLILFSYLNADQQLFFEHLSVAEGLSQSTITCIYQDKAGFLWFGTSNGLNKYDGYSFTIYHHNPANNSSLSNEMINTIYEDSKGNLWIGTDAGINLYNRFTETFTRFDISNGKDEDVRKTVTSLAEDQKGNLYAASFGHGLFRYNPSDKKFTHIIIEKHSYNYISDIFKDNDGIFWLAAYGGLVKFNTVTGKFNYFRTSNEEKASGRITTIKRKSDSELYAGTAEGLLVFNTKEEKFYNPYCSGDYPKDLCNKIILSLFIDSRNNLWIGTDGGGAILHDRNKNFYQFKNNPVFQGSLSDNIVMAIYEDKSGILWFGSGLSGLNKLSQSKIKFTHYKKEPLSSNSILSNYIYSLYKDRDGIIWIGSSEGLTSLDRLTGKVKYYRENLEHITSNFITSLAEDKSGNLWVGTNKGLNRFDKNRKLIKVYKSDTFDSNSLRNSFITYIYPGKDNSIWILSLWGGIHKLDLSNNKITSFPLTKQPGNFRSWCMIEDKEGYFWIGTYSGLYKFDRNNNSYKVYHKNPKDPNSINNDFIFSLYEDNEGNIWAGSYGGGLNKLDKKTGKFIHFSEDQGLPNNVVYGILPDEEGNLWLSTNKGICRFNMRTYAVRNYDLSEGLQSFEYNSGAYYKSSDGEMFFGGLNGFNSFYPSMVKDNPHVPSINITSVKVLDKKFDPADKTLELSYNQNFLSFEFVSLDFANPRNNKYKYKLEGFDKDFIAAGTRRFASYTNLEPGEYRFIVLGSSSDDVWNNTGAALYIIIHPPFWRTWWFYIFAFAAGALLIYSVHKYRVRLKINRLMQLEEMRKRLADDFHDELGHKLTKISLYSELMKRELTGKLNGNAEYLTKISTTANSLYDDTKDFIWSIDPGKDTLYDLAVYLKDFGDELFDKTGIGFRVNEISLALQKILLPMDWKRQLILLFKEGMNNVLKHSQCKTVDLQIELKENAFEIELKDDGLGMMPDREAKGRGLNNMNNRAKKIGGDLLIDSDDKGTVVRFSRSLNHIESKS